VGSRSFWKPSGAPRLGVALGVLVSSRLISVALWGTFSIKGLSIRRRHTSILSGRFSAIFSKPTALEVARASSWAHRSPPHENGFGSRWIWVDLLTMTWLRHHYHGPRATRKIFDGPIPTPLGLVFRPTPKDWGHKQKFAAMEKTNNIPAEKMPKGKRSVSSFIKPLDLPRYWVVSLPYNPRSHRRQAWLRTGTSILSVSRSARASRIALTLPTRWARDLLGKLAPTGDD